EREREREREREKCYDLPDALTQSPPLTSSEYIGDPAEFILDPEAINLSWARNLEHPIDV
ncbi:MAG: hypothetical protein KTM48_01090, partial [Wolbachia endosymbiont of Pissodes strobi]|nr:hypothetical protein [Wolbachia endosymbiont of Pissodes strobi]